MRKGKDPDQDADPEAQKHMDPEHIQCKKGYQLVQTLYMPRARS
jgi:hypothetical protein